MKRNINELNYQKDLNNLMQEKVAHLEMNLKNSKVSSFFFCLPIGFSLPLTIYVLGFIFN